MNQKIAIIAILVIAIAGTLIMKNRAKSHSASKQTNVSNDAGQQAGLPRLIDIGKGKCEACKAMYPVMDELRANYGGKLVVEYIDLGTEREKAEKYEFSMIPAQVFVDADGKVLKVHEGFFSTGEIVNEFKNLGIDLEKAE